MGVQSFIKKKLAGKNLSLTILICLMAASASVWLGYEFWRLLLDSSPLGAVDLKQRYEEVFFWFRGFPIYGVIRTASYPPASYLMLWPFMGWLTTTAACQVWAFTSAACLLWLSAIFLKASNAGTRTEKIFIFLIPLSMYAAGAAIGNGQLIVHVLPVLLASILLLHGKRITLRTELAASCLFILALVKPSIAAPFFWIVLFVPGRLRIPLFIIAGYTGLTILSGSFQDQSLSALVSGWVDSSRDVLSRMAFRFSYSNLNSWLYRLGLESLSSYASILALLLLGAWTRLNRQADIWLIISVTAITARLWTYHAWYDDLLIAPAIITLFRITKTHSLPGYWPRLIPIIMYVSILFLLAPGGHFLLPSPFKESYIAGQALTWVIMLFLLAWLTRKKFTPAENKAVSLKG